MERPVTGDGTGGDPAAVDGLVRAAFAAVFLLVAQQIAGKATRDALFLSNFPVTALPLVSGATAALSLAGVAAFARGMARSQPPVMMKRALAANAIVLAALWAAARSAPRVAAIAVYVQTGVFGATLVSGLWSVINERFDPHTARRVVGRIGTGASLGAVLGGLLTWRAAPYVGLAGLLLAMAALNLACLLVLRWIAGSAVGATRSEAASEASPVSALTLIRRRPFLRDLALLVGLGAWTEAVLDYLLNAAVAREYASGAALLSFFALFHAAVAVSILTCQTVLARRSLQGLGLGATLALQPAAVALGGAVVAVVPGFWPQVVLRGSHAVLRNSLFRSAYELLFTPIPPAEKRPTKALLDVGADRLGTIAGSALIALVLLMPAGLATRALLLVASASAAITLLLTRRLHAGYVGALANSLRAGTIHLDPEDVLDPTTRGLLAEARPAPAPPVPMPDGPMGRTQPVLDAAASLQSGDAHRIAAVLRGPPLAVELVPFVIPLLARDDLFTDAVAALRVVAPRCVGQLVDVLLDVEEDAVVRRRVPRVLKVVPLQRTVDGLLAALRDERLDIRYRSAQALLHLQSHPSLTIPAGDALATSRRELGKGRPTSRGLDHVFALLALGLPGEPLVVALRAWRSADASLKGTALEYLENVLPGDIALALRPWLGAPPSPTGRSLDEIRDDLLRSTASFGIRVRSGAGARPRPPR